MNNATTRPKLSVVTAVLNEPRALLQTCNCIIQQKNDSIEHIIVDGGSDGPTQEILQYAKESGASIISKPDTGIYQALNRGVNRASGKYIQIIHAGDLYPPSALIRLTDELPENSSVIFYSDCRVGGRLVEAPGDVSPGMNLYNLSIAHQSLIVPASVYNDIGEYNEDFRIVSDHIWMRRAYTNGVRFQKIPDLPVYIEPNGLSSGKCASDKQLFDNEIIERTAMYFPFLSRTQCELILAARTSAQARTTLLKFASSEPLESKINADTWHDFKVAAFDYIEKFSN